MGSLSIQLMVTPNRHFYLGPYTLQDNGPRFKKVWMRPHEQFLTGAIDLRSAAQRRNLAAVQGVGLFVYSQAVTDSALTSFGTNIDATFGTAGRNQFRGLTGISANGTNLRAVLGSALTTAADPTGAAVLLPAMPTSAGNLEIWAAGRLASVRLRPTDAAWTNSTLLRLREIYQSVRTECQSMYPVGDRRRNRYKKLLGSWRRKYQTVFGDTPDYRIFLPSPEDDEGFEEPQTTITDDFTRADGDTIGNLLTWTEVSGDLDTFSNTVGIATTGGSEFEQNARAETALSSDDHYAQISVTTLNIPPAGASCFGAAARFAAAAEQYYGAGVTRTANGNMSYKTIDVDGGAETSIGTNTGPEAASALPFTMRIQPDGSNINRLKNGVTQDTVSDTTWSGTLFCGINGSLNAGSTPGDARGDNFEASDGLGGIKKQAIMIG